MSTKDKLKAMKEAVATIEKQFAFDIELLLLTDAAGGAIDRFPVAWIDSEAASTTDDGIYLTMLKAVATMYRGHDRHADQAEAFVELVEEMSPEAWHRLLDNAPMTLLDHDPTEEHDLNGWWSNGQAMLRLELRGRLADATSSSGSASGSSQTVKLTISRARTMFRSTPSFGRRSCWRTAD